MSFAVSGVNCAAATPLNADLTPDLGLFAEHCHRLLAEGCHGIALLGTTGEANSFSVAERKRILEAALKAGIAGDQLIPGTGVAAGPETVELTRHALDNGVSKVVMLPPFYYKGVSDEGVFAAYARVIEAIGDRRLKVVLYHIPQMSAVPLSHALIARLIAAFPNTVVGIKDSGGDLANMQAIAAAHPGFAVLAGADPLMLPLLKSGGAGCITATSNLIAGALRTIYDNLGDEAKVTAAQDRINAWRALSNSYVQIPTIKAMVGLKTGNPAWNRVLPPMLPLADAQLADLKPKFAALP
jgi:4-hydroxy-tetrahydrodipicolinate synthase